MSAISIFANVENKVHVLLKAEFGKADLNLIEPSEKPEAVQILKRYASGELPGKKELPVHKEMARHLLIELGDASAIQQLMREYRGGPLQSLGTTKLFSKSAQPLLIPLLAEDLNRDEPVKSRIVNNEFFLPAYSVWSAGIIQSILINSEEFSSKTRAWASGLSTKAENREEFRSAMRTWWQVNKEHFGDRKNYAEVSLGPASAQKQSGPEEKQR